MKYYYAFVGQNTTHGEPHPRTGFYSIFGHLHAFTTKAKRDDYVDGTNWAKKTSRSASRRYFLGLTYTEFQQHLDYVDSNVDEVQL